MLERGPNEMVLRGPWHHWSIVSIRGRSNGGSIHSTRELAVPLNHIRVITRQPRPLKQFFERRQSTFEDDNLAISKIHCVLTRRTYTRVSISVGTPLMTNPQGGADAISRKHAEIMQRESRCMGRNGPNSTVNIVNLLRICLKPTSWSEPKVIERDDAGGTSIVTGMSTLLNKCDVMQLLRDRFSVPNDRWASLL